MFKKIAGLFKKKPEPAGQRITVSDPKSPVSFEVGNPKPPAFDMKKWVAENNRKARRRTGWFMDLVRRTRRGQRMAKFTRPRTDPFKCEHRWRTKIKGHLWECRLCGILKAREVNG